MLLFGSQICAHCLPLILHADINAPQCVIAVSPDKITWLTVTAQSSMLVLLSRARHTVDGSGGRNSTSVPGPVTVDGRGRWMSPCAMLVSIPLGMCGIEKFQFSFGSFLKNLDSVQNRDQIVGNNHVAIMYWAVSRYRNIVTLPAQH